MYVFSHSVTSDSLYPMDCSQPGSSVLGILLARILELVTISSSRGFSWPRSPHLLHLLLCRCSLYHWAFTTGKGHDRDYLGLKRGFFLKETDSFAHQPVLLHHIPSLEIKKIGPVETGHWDAFLWATYPSSTEGILPSASEFLMDFQKCLRPEKKLSLKYQKKIVCLICYEVG